MSYLSWKAQKYVESKVDMLDYFHYKRFYSKVSAQKKTLTKKINL